MNRNYPGIQRVLLVTLLLNLLASCVKLAAGIWTGALSLIADGLDTLFDGVSNVIGMIAVRVSSQPPDKEHPYGHRKFETLAALFIASALFLTAWELTRGAVERLLTPPPVSVSLWGVGALLLGSVVQGTTGMWELYRARELQSEVLRADARHTLASLGVSAAVFVGLGLVWLGYARADSAVTLIVAVVIAKLGVDTVRENVPALVDRAPLEADNIGAIVDSVGGVESFHRIRSRGTPDNVAIDLHIRVAPNLAMQDANAIADEVRRRLLALPGVGDVTVHAEAQRGSESSVDLYSAAKLAAQEYDMILHEYWVQAVNEQLSIHLHVGVDPYLTLNEAHDMVDRLEKTILQRQPDIASVRSHIELATSEILPTASVSNSMQQHIHRLVEEAALGIHSVRNPHDIQIRQVEGKLFITLEALVDGSLSVAEAHELSTQLQEAIRAAIPNVGEALVHLEPY